MLEDSKSNQLSQGDETTRALSRKTFASNEDFIEFGEIWKAILRRKKIFYVTASSIFIAFGVTTTYLRIFRPVYIGQFSLMIQDPIVRNEIDKNLMADEGIFGLAARSGVSADVPTLVSLLKSPFYLSDVAKEFNINPRSLAGMLSIDHPSVFAGRRPRGVLDVKLEINNRELGQKILEALAKRYLEAALEQKTESLIDGLKFLNNQEPSLRLKTIEIQSKLEAFREKYGVIDPTYEGRAIKIKERDIRDDILFLEKEIASLKNVRKQIINRTISASGFGDSLGGFNSNSGLEVTEFDKGLLDQLIKAESELAAARTKFTENSEVVKGLKSRLNKLEPLVIKNQLKTVDIALEINYKNLDTLKNQRLNNKTDFLEQPYNIKVYTNLTTQLKIAERNLQSLMSARDRYQLQMAQKSIPWRIISSAKMESSPIKPSIPINLMLGILTSAVGGIGASLLRDKLDYVYRNSSEVTEELDVPLLAHIPHVTFFEGVREDNRFLFDDLDNLLDSEEDKEKEKYERFFYQESLRNLYTSIRFLNSEKQLKSIAITSSLPSEGKSLLNALLSKTIAEMGIKVVLIDADMRKPQLHHRLGVNNLKGLSNVLIDRNNSLEDVIQKVPANENWFVITAGTKPPDPTRLLSSNRMKEINDELIQSGKYDLVLYDTPPILGLADAALVAANTDGMILLVSLNNVDRSMPIASLERIYSSGATLLGVVTNALKPELKSETNSYYSQVYASYAIDEPTKINENIDAGIQAREKLSKRQLIRKEIIDLIKKLKDKAAKFINWIEN
ncbi:polysaccharide biosynthesis tyrosine autokinase [Prochlorococcus sp. MIT 1223]|uniref:polysaccharide biosynthesis tyrosine autokinase n=1 Tax=Prochlorococcus sp. MIT 1223 TaxID=3096217 RepID=UPI002A7498C6|nr:polysaccharide biosynthesis tyrosine autokinase [Prochlorococcus sp. MIT 1223]